MPKRIRSHHETVLEHLRDPAAAAHYLNAALEESNEVFVAALRDVAEAHQLPEATPEIENLITTLRASGLKLKVEESAA